MPTRPQASLSIATTGGAYAGGDGYAVIMACVGKNADGVPRVFTGISALIDQPGKIAFAFTKNQVQLRNAFNKGLAVVRHNGTLLRLKNKWIP